MGVFLQMGGFAAPVESVQTALSNNTYVGYQDEHILHSVEKNRVLLLFDGNAQGCEQVVEELSRELKCPAFWFHVHDDDLWMYLFYQSGVEVDRFNTMPGYWQPVSDDERTSWAGNSQKIAQIWPDLEAKDIEDYLVDHESPDFDGQQEAYENDFVPGLDCWQIIDFINKLGLDYPE